MIAVYALLACVLIAVCVLGWNVYCLATQMRRLVTKPDAPLPDLSSLHANHKAILDEAAETRKHVMAVLESKTASDEERKQAQVELRDLRERIAPILRRELALGVGRRMALDRIKHHETRPPLIRRRRNASPK